MNSILQKILEAKEKRALLRQSISERKMSSVSLSLNIPEYPKTNENLTLFFSIVLKKLKTYLLANRVIFNENSEVLQVDEAGNYFIVGISSYNKDVSELKVLTEKFEEKHKLGRFIDVDVADENGNYISSNKLKLCYYCEEHPAIVCMREKKHSFTELRTFISEKINKFLAKKKSLSLIEQLSSIALKSILYEVSLSPKPGLVDFISSGSHNDMNYYTFINSSSALAPFFQKFAELGYNFDEDDLSNALSAIRDVGLQAEQAMFKATNNINTQKGIIFLMGISLFSVSFIFSKENQFNVSSFVNTVKIICQNLVKEELENLKTHKTHGELCFKKYGLKGAGARFEVEQGFPTVINFALPILEKYLKGREKEIIDLALEKTLLKIISKNNDSNILFRKGSEVLEKLRMFAGEAFIDDKKYKKVCDFCIDENISPGGSADLLAITIFIHFVKEIKNEF